MSTALSIAYSHTIDAYTKGIDQNGPYIRVNYKISNWSDTDQFCRELMGIGILTGPIAGGTITRNNPHQHPLGGGIVCISANVIEGLGNPVLNSFGYPDYDGGAIIQAEYRTPPFDIQGSQNAINNQFDQSLTAPLLYCTQELDFTTETYSHKAKMTYQSGPASGSPIDIPAKYTIPITHLSLTFHKLPYMPMTAVRLLRGRVNSATFLGATTGTVLFNGAKTTREYNSDGTIVQKLTLLFSERDALHPWNSLPSQTTATWYPVAASDGSKLFPTADLNPLLAF